MDLLITFITWLALIQGCSFIAYPILLRVTDSSTISYSLSKCVGVFIFGYAAWVLGLMQLISVDIPSLVALLTLLSVCSHSIVRSTWGSWDSLPYPDAKALKNIELLFWGSFFIAIIIYAFHPEIYWGEKPMDHTFLNFFTRNTTLPPQDPWSAGNTMNYYYLGSLVMGLLHKLSGLNTSYGYGFSVSLIAAMMVTGAYSAVYTITRSQRWAIIGSIAVICMGTIDALYLLLTKKFPFGFDLYWATSRTLHSPGINEYPLWSILFADLHAHFIGLPLTLCFITSLLLLIQRWMDKDIRTLIPHTVMCGFLWGLLSVVNSWDYITYGILAAILIALYSFTPFFESSIRSRVNLSAIGILMFVVSIITSIPFHISVSANAQIGWGYVMPEEFNSFGEVIRIHGHWIIIVLLSPIVLFTLLTERSKPWSLWGIFSFLICGFLPILLGLVHLFVLEIPEAPWGVLGIATGVSASGMLIVRLGKRDSMAIVGGVLVAAGTIYAISELYYLMDRMNTTFKVYNAIWMLLGISAMSLVARWSRAIPNFSWKSPTIICVSPVILCAFAGTIICVASMLTFQRIGGPRPSLNGSAYLNTFNPTEKLAFDWINMNIKGTPVMVEAWGPSYQEYTRFSMHTGLPVVVGWEYHILQRGTPHDEISTRKNDVQTIYVTPDPITAIRLLNKYHVEIIVVGAMERKAYGSGGLSKFDTNPNLFIPLFSAGSGNQEIKLYTTVYSTIKP